MTQSVFRSTIVRYKISAPGSKYMGVYLKAFTDNLRADVVQPILAKYNIREINPGAWMEGQIQLDMLRDIEAQCSFEELVAVGMKAGELFALPPEIDSMDKFLEASPIMYEIGLNGASPEERVSVEKLGNAHYRLTYNLPFPPFVMYGSTYGVLKQVKKPDEFPVMTVVEDGTPYIFDITW
ncbi:MAG TPA: hypothetical protein VHL11_08730 [Phototrophicaceae bacterium]|nr:hypothetical protein [Phototrophicaceae bacterium]